MNSTNNYQISNGVLFQASSHRPLFVNRASGRGTMVRPRRGNWLPWASLVLYGVAMTVLQFIGG